MSHPLQHPTIRTLIDRVARVFSQEDVYLTVDRHLLFVCGGPVSPSDHSLRIQFLSYAAVSLPNFRVFLAEAAATDIFAFTGPHFLNLVQFEDFIASYSDCIILFPESPGALAEIGFFAASPRICPKLLVANDLVMQAEDSFINNGPLAQVNAQSAFRPVIHLDMTRPPVDFSPIRQRLRRFPSKQRHRFTFSSYDKLSPIARISILLEIVNLFWPISLDGILFVISFIFGNAVLSDLQRWTRDTGP